MRVIGMVVGLAMTGVAMAQEPSPDLPDPATLIKTGQCETAPGTTTAAIGADQTYTGVLQVNESGQVHGVEQRHISPNSRWRSTAAPDGTRGQDCVVTWVVTGQVGPPQNCRDCDISIQFEANQDPAQSTCNQRLMADGAHFRGSYDVKKNADGTLGVFFSNSGNPLGTGRWSNDQMIWHSSHKCIWM